MDKVAICFSGHIRDIIPSIEYWKKIIKKYNADVYASFWDVSDYIQEEINKTSNKQEIDKLKFENEYIKHLFITELKPKKIEFEDIINFKPTIDIYTSEISPPLDLNEVSADYSRSGNNLSMFYKIWRANCLTKSDDYDIIVRTRLDIFLDDNFIIEKNNHINIPTSDTFIHKWKNCFGPTDVLAYGNSKIMDYYSSLFLYLTRYLKDCHYMYPNENLIKVHLAHKNLLINYFDSKVTIYKHKNPVFSGVPRLVNSMIDISTDKEYTFYKKNNNFK